jgi:hypothetical protein
MEIYIKNRLVIIDNTKDGYKLEIIAMFIEVQLQEKK